ncbi:HTTM domain-containing protein [Mycetocola zhadangensis]|uniref:HTTM-like domain-containing protein n=1 Tax=Mycetocola zhadangensis TaxID=1164595 RepID=A0A3L7J0U5_9MICO|nr:HTTM domain-containing protein [Mycetocola zhadangensis]RLQ84126.1 hypothetical protein D9V28_07790 [Mycetocola zhadangensis]GGE95951.1 HTTM domain-containing protein [Mycetocola zhadangensis]
MTTTPSRTKKRTISATDASRKPQATASVSAFSVSNRFDALVRWITDAKRATYSLSALRIVYGTIILAFLSTNLRDRHYLWGVASAWVEPEAKRRGWAEILRVLFSKDNAFLFDVAYGALFVLALVFLVGWQTRFVTPLLTLFWVGLSTNSAVLTNGGDTIMRISLLFLVFANLSQHWSVDAWLRRKRGPTRKPVLKGWFTFPSWVGNAAHNAAVMLCAYQILLVYVNSGIYKLMGEEWRDGTAFYYSVVLDVFRPFPALSDLTWQWEFGVYVATFLSIWVQLLFPLFLLWRPTRIVALVFILGMHLGIGLFLGLWPFSLAMIALDLLFVRDSSWCQAIIWLRGVSATLREIVQQRRAPALAQDEPAPAEPTQPEVRETAGARS